MPLTDYHAKYFAHELTKRCPSDSPEKFGGTLVDAQVDLNPHQIEAALFAFRLPLSRGAPLADEVGLGKTIEAGLILCLAFRGKSDRFPNLTIKKIPNVVLKRCEWGHDDYSLRVENLPKAPTKPGQLLLFEEEIEP